MMTSNRGNPLIGKLPLLRRRSVPATVKVQTGKEKESPILENGHRLLVKSISEVCILLLSRLSLGDTQRVLAILKEYFQEDPIERREALYAFLDRVCYEGLTRSEWLEALSCAVTDWCKAHDASFHPYKTVGDYLKYRSKQFLA